MMRAQLVANQQHRGSTLEYLVPRGCLNRGRFDLAPRRRPVPLTRRRASAWIDRCRRRLLTRAFPLVVVSAFGVMLAIGMLLPVLPLYAKGPLGVGDIGVGLAVAAASPTALLLQPFAGRYGRPHRAAAVCWSRAASSSADGVLLYTVADSLALLTALRLATGVGEALMFVATATIVNDLAPPRRTGEAVSLYSLAIWGGLAAGPLLGELILDGDRYDAVWVAAGVSALARGSCRAGVARDATRAPCDHPHEPRARRSMIHPAARGPGTVLLLGMIGFAGFATFVPLYARELGLAGAGAVFAVNAVIVVAIRQHRPHDPGPVRPAACGDHVRGVPDRRRLLDDRARAFHEGLFAGDRDRLRAGRLSRSPR